MNLAMITIYSACCFLLLVIGCCCSVPAKEVRLKGSVNEIVMFPSPGSGRRMPYENMTISLTDPFRSSRLKPKLTSKTWPNTSCGIPSPWKR
jgi:hypothetical protein